MRKMIFKVLIFIILIHIILFVCLYFFQEKLIFHSQKLDKDYQFAFEGNYEEINIKSTDGALINGLLFKVENPQGVILFLHGNAGTLDSWGHIANTYTELNYDFFIFDYRSYGKSEGKINNQNQLFQDNQAIYEELMKRYKEDEIVIIGHSIGTGLASKLASDNKPKLLILQAPYYSLTDLLWNNFFFPPFILKYKIETNKYLKNCEMPVVIFHGNQDEIVYYGSSLKLKEEFKPQDKLITLEGVGHNDIINNRIYRMDIEKILKGDFK